MTIIGIPFTRFRLPTAQSLIAIVMLIGAVLGSGFSERAWAEDVAGSQDYPLLGRYQGSEIVGYEVTEYDETTVLDGPFDPVDTSKWSGPGFKDVEGRIVLIYYKLPEGRSTLEVMRNYEDSLKSKGFSVVFACATSKGTCFQSGEPDAGYLLGSAIGDPLRLPKLSDDYVHNWFQEGGRYLLAKLDRPEGAVYAALYLGESNQGNVAVVRIVETKQMETGKIEFISASDMNAALTERGKVSIYGILFDFDKDVIKPESKPNSRRDRQPVNLELRAQAQDRRPHGQQGHARIQPRSFGAARGERGDRARVRLRHRRGALVRRGRRHDPARRHERHGRRARREPASRTH